MIFDEEAYETEVAAYLANTGRHCTWFHGLDRFSFDVCMLWGLYRRAGV